MTRCVSGIFACGQHNGPRHWGTKEERTPFIPSSPQGLSEYRLSDPRRALEMAIRALVVDVILEKPSRFRRGPSKRRRSLADGSLVRLLLCFRIFDDLDKSFSQHVGWCETRFFIILCRLSDEKC
jgi:hypothetical protein